MEGLIETAFWFIIVIGVLIVIDKIIDVISARIHLDDSLEEAHDKTHELSVSHNNCSKRVDSLSEKVDEMIFAHKKEVQALENSVDEILSLVDDLIIANENVYEKIELLDELTSPEKYAEDLGHKKERYLNVIREDIELNRKLIELIKQREAKSFAERKERLEKRYRSQGDGGLSR